MEDQPETSDKGHRTSRLTDCLGANVLMEPRLGSAFLPHGATVPSSDREVGARQEQEASNSKKNAVSRPWSDSELSPLELESNCYL